MKTEYKRDLNHIYLIVKGIRLDPDSYQVRMLAGNSVPAILNCRIVSVDGEFLLYFDITSKQKLSSLSKDRQLSHEDLFLILSETVSAMEQMEEYLLKAEQLLLDPEYIYLDAERRKLYFCMLPGEKGDPGEKFRLLMESLLPWIDHGRNDAVTLGYGVYRIAASDSFSLDKIKDLLYHGAEENRNPKTAAGRIMDENRRYRRGEEDAAGSGMYASPDILFGDTRAGRVTGDPSVRKEKTETGKTEIKEKEELFRRFLVPGICLLAAAVLLLLAAGSVYGWIPEISVEVILGAGIICLGGGLLIYRLLGRRVNAGESSSEQKEMPLASGRDFTDDEWLRPEHTELSLFRGYEEEEEDVGETVLVRPEHTGPSVILKSRGGEGTPDIVPENEITLIGKLKTACDVTLQEPTVSRIHARIRREEEDFYLMDMNSRNGTFVNGHALETGEEHLLKNGDKIEFAKAEYVFLRKSAEAETGRFFSGAC